MRMNAWIGAIVLLMLATPVWAGAVCTDISDQCLTTAAEDCDANTQEVVVQIGGPGAEDSNGDGGTCQGTNATALLTFTKVDGDTYTVTVENTTCGDNGSVTAVFHNTTDTVTAASEDALSALAGVVDVNWFLHYEQTTPTDGDNNNGPKADGFGHFDIVIYNGDSASPNGGDKRDIRPGEKFRFEISLAPGYELCDFLTEISTPTPGDRNRVAVGRWQACGADEQNSAYIGPCTPDGELLAVIDRIVLTPDDRRMRVEWSTSLEIENAGFNVLRREATRGGWEQINVDLLPGRGDTVTGAEYEFVDETALNGVEYMYRIEDIDFGGRNNLSDIHREVANPRNPRVKLVDPAYGATVALSNRTRFAFDGDAGNTILQISSDPTFSESSTVSTQVSRRFGGSEFTLDPRTSRIATSIARASDGIVYWRLVDRSRDAVSDTFRLEVEDDLVGSVGHGAREISRAGGNR
ncbi:MAG TPA: hypothetical protein VD788_04935 [Candidatus Polarisedimenticolaceae bacterium]|nr:hypothetical protein [Candidatus Polarisedimenticolaceae bacterium]